MAVEKKKKRMIRVNCSKDVNASCEPWNYASGTPSLYYGLCGKEITIKDGDRFKQQVAGAHSCREVLSGRVYGQEAEKDKRHVPIDMDALRMLMVGSNGRTLTADVIKSRLFSAKRIMNLIEDYNGWEKSTIATVIHVNLKKDSHSAYLFTGPKEYVRYPQMMSLVCLIFRLSFNGLVLKNESLDEFFAGIMAAKKDASDAIQATENPHQLKKDIEYLSEVIPHLKRLFNKFNKVFEGSYKKYYPKDRDHFTGDGGITSLINCSTGDAPLHKRMSHHVLKKTKTI